MRLSMQLLCAVWISSVTTLLCSAVPLSSLGERSDASLTGTSIHSPTFIEPAESYENKGSEEETDDGDVAEDEAGKDEDDYDEEENANTDEPPTEPFTDFDDSEDLSVLAKGILGSNDNKESVVPCFGTWWPSSGGYVYYYEDYGNGGTVDTDGDSDYSDYNRRRRNRRTRRRRTRRNRSKRARTSRRAAKKKA